MNKLEKKKNKEYLRLLKNGRRLITPPHKVFRDKTKYYRPKSKKDFSE